MAGLAAQRPVLLFQCRDLNLGIGQALAQFRVLPIQRQRIRRRPPYVRKLLFEPRLVTLKGLDLAGRVRILGADAGQLRLQPLLLGALGLAQGDSGGA